MKTVLLCLHGWGGSKESFAELRSALKDSDIELLVPDMPGFGSEPEPKEPWTNDDYGDWVVNYAKKQLPTTNCSFWDILTAEELQSNSLPECHPKS
jgi:esterase/lipase